MGAVADCVVPGEVWVAERNFCVAGLLYAIEQQAAFFIIRQHGGLTTKPLEPMRRVGSSDTGAVHEQAVQLASPTGERWSLRRITVTLNGKTRNADTALVILPRLGDPYESAHCGGRCHDHRRLLALALGYRDRLPKAAAPPRLRDRDLGLPPGQTHQKITINY